MTISTIDRLCQVIMRSIGHFFYHNGRLGIFVMVVVIIIIVVCLVADDVDVAIVIVVVITPLQRRNKV